MNARATIHKCSAVFRAVRWFALFGLLFPKLCLGAESPVVVEPGTTNAPGLALEDSLVAFRWRAAQGATGYKLIIGDSETRELEEYTFPATILFSQVSLIAGRRYFWHVSTLVGTNPAAVSTTNFFTIVLNPVYPVIFGVVPNPVPAVDGAQALIVNGREFRRGCTLVLRDKTTGESFRNLKMAARRNSQFVVTPNFTKAEGIWTVEVLNPGGFNSGEFAFEVVAPARLAGWRWRQGGWPWALVGLLCSIAGAGWIFWRRSRVFRTIALAQEEARRQEHGRLSRDLHDSVNDLNQINLLAGTLKLMAEKNNQIAEVRDTAGKVSFAVVEAINGIEDMIWVSQQENQNLSNLVARLRQIVGRFREFNPELHCELDFPLDLSERKVSSELNAHLLRITSEALRNILKHARAHHVRCHLAVKDNRLRLAIEDDGCGFDPKSTKTTGRGVSNIRRRAEELGGEFTFQSAPGEGTKIAVEIPLG